MPRIEGYQQQVTPDAVAPGRRATGEDFGAGIGEGMQRVGQAGFGLAGAIEQNQIRDDVNNVQVMMSQARADWTNHLLDRSKYANVGLQTPEASVEVGGTDASAADEAHGKFTQTNVDNFASGFMQDFNDYVSQARQNVRTKRGQQVFDALAANLGADMQEKSFAAQAELAGVKAIQDHKAVFNNYRNAMLTSGVTGADDPNFKNTLSLMQDYVAGLDHVPAAARLQLIEQDKEKLALSAVEGMIHQDPQGALKSLQDNEWGDYLQADKTEMMMRRAHMGIMAQEAEAARQQKAQDLMQRKVNMEVENGFLQQMEPTDQNPAGTLTHQMILDSSLDPQKKIEYMRILDQKSKDTEDKPHPEEYRQLFSEIHLPPGHPNKIVDENQLNSNFIAGSLNWRELTNLRKEVQDARTPQGERLGNARKDLYAAVKPTFIKDPVLPDPEGSLSYYRWQQWADEQIDTARQNNQDPYELLRPGTDAHPNPKFIGSPSALGAFTKSLNQKIESQMGGVQKAPGITGGKVEPRQQGESAEDYLKRIRSK